MYFRTKRVLFNILGGILAGLIVLVGFFSCVVITLNLVYIKTNVVGYSMLPTLNSNVATAYEEGDCVYINRFAECEVGDVVVAEVDWNGSDKYVIKRLIGKPGDKIQIKEVDGVYNLYVNDSLLYSKEKSEHDKENNLGSTKSYFEYTYLKFFNKSEFSNIVFEDDNREKYILLGDDDYFIMGDNWGRTDDSLKYGPVKKCELVGRVDVVVPYKEAEQGYILKLIMNSLFN